MILKNALVCDENFEFIKTDITVENSVITSLEKTDADGIDCSGKRIVPGFIDIHTHGCNRADCTDGKKESVKEMSRFLARHGVTSFCPTTMTLPLSELKKLSVSYLIRQQRATISLTVL